MLPPPSSPLPPIHILGIDPGYGRCGTALLAHTPHGDTLLHSGCIETDAKLPFIERVALVTAGIRDLVTTYTPDVCALEKLYFTKNQKTGMQVAELRGALLILAHECGLRVVEHGPGEVKAAITGDGRADKRQVQTMVRHLVALRSDIRHDDEYDAVAVALTAAAHYRFRAR